MQKNCSDFERRFHLISPQNTCGDAAYTKNESHKEAFFMEWFHHAYMHRYGLQQLDIQLNLSPCAHCAGILSEISDTQASVGS